MTEKKIDSKVEVVDIFCIVCSAVLRDMQWEFVKNANSSENF